LGRSRERVYQKVYDIDERKKTYIKGFISLINPFGGFITLRSFLSVNTSRYSFHAFLLLDQKRAEVCHNHDSIEQKTLYLLLYHTLIFATYPDGYTITRVADGFRKRANPRSTIESVLIF
jgi:hypothetical protein